MKNLKKNWFLSILAQFAYIRKRKKFPKTRTLPLLSANGSLTSWIMSRKTNERISIKTCSRGTNRWTSHGIIFPWTNEWTNGWMDKPKFNEIRGLRELRELALNVTKAYNNLRCFGGLICWLCSKWVIHIWKYQKQLFDHPLSLKLCLDLFIYQLFIIN